LNLENLKLKLREFSKDRDWEQFHNPKNLATALSVEASELLEIFQWSNDGGLKEIDNPEKRQEIEKEIADIFNYLVKLVDILDIDLEEAALNKIKENAEKYPIETSKGKSMKYTEFNEKVGNNILKSV
jgi:NTP pyrophosphatase (non-canonical NTP hydrolase)